MLWIVVADTLSWADVFVLLFCFSKVLFCLHVCCYVGDVCLFDCYVVGFDGLGKLGVVVVGLYYVL